MGGQPRRGGGLALRCRVTESHDYVTVITWRDGRGHSAFTLSQHLLVRQWLKEAAGPEKKLKQNFTRSCQLLRSRLSQRPVIVVIQPNNRTIVSTRSKGRIKRQRQHVVAGTIILIHQSWIGLSCEWIVWKTKSWSRLWFFSFFCVAIGVNFI